MVGGWVENIIRWRAALRQWTSAKTIRNQQMTNKLISKVDQLDKWELTDLTNSKINSRRILKDELNEIYGKEEFF